MDVRQAVQLPELAGAAKQCVMGARTSGHGAEPMAPFWGE